MLSTLENLIKLARERKSSPLEGSYTNKLLTDKALSKSKVLEEVDELIEAIEKDTNKIFKRFYSNRPDKFGQHSGLGLNIVKNLVDLHNATIKATNRTNQQGASIEIVFPHV